MTTLAFVQNGEVVVITGLVRDLTKDELFTLGRIAQQKASTSDEWAEAAKDWCEHGNSISLEDCSVCDAEDHAQEDAYQDNARDGVALGPKHHCLDENDFEEWSDDKLHRMAPAEHTHPSVIADDRDLTHSHDGGAIAHAHPTYEYRS